MTTNLEDRFIEIVRGVPTTMRVLETVRALDLPDWMVFSGAVYQPVWNQLTGRAPDYGIKDYDVAYHDDSDTSYEAEDVVIKRVAAAFEPPLRDLVEVRNQARVHLWFNKKFGADEPYPPLENSAAALKRFVATAFCVGVRLEPDDRPVEQQQEVIEAAVLDAERRGARSMRQLEPDRRPRGRALS